MLNAINLQKTFNPGTINEKVALTGATLYLEGGRILHSNRWKWSR